MNLPLENPAYFLGLMFEIVSHSHLLRLRALAKLIDKKIPFAGKSHKNLSEEKSQRHKNGKKKSKCKKGEGGKGGEDECDEKKTETWY